MSNFDYRCGCGFANPSPMHIDACKHGAEYARRLLKHHRTTKADATLAHLRELQNGLKIVVSSLGKIIEIAERG